MLIYILQSLTLRMCIAYYLSFTYNNNTKTLNLFLFRNYFIFPVASVVLCGGRKTSPGTSS